MASTLEKGTDEVNPVKIYKFPSEARGKPAREAAFPASRLARLKRTIGSLAYGMYLAYNACNPGRMFCGDNGGQALLAEALDAKAETGVIRFCKTDPDQKELIDELLQFPDGEYKDGPDALEGVVRKLREYARKRRAGMPSASRPRESGRVLRGYE
jgi:hypothetical protein